MALIGAVVAIGGFLTLATSQSVKHWITGHPYLAYIALIATVAAALVIIDIIAFRKRKLATYYDKKVASEFFEMVAQDSSLIAWLKSGVIGAKMTASDLELLGKARDSIKANVIGFDSRRANKAYRSLETAMSDYLVVGTSLVKGSGNWDKADAQNKRSKLIEAYDNLVIVCHKSKIS